MTTPKTKNADANVDSVIRKLARRSHIGVEKYGTTTERKDVDLRGWLEHLQEELMDAAVYIEAALQSGIGKR